MRFVYPKGLRKALTFSYDDGQIHDRRLAELLRNHGMKGTFHLNSGTLETGDKGSFYVSEGELKEVYQGHEIACHGVQHRSPTTITGQQMLLEIQEDRKSLEKLTGELVQGMSYAFGNYSPEVIETVKNAGIKYSRTVNSSHGFFLPADFMQWHPTCHHNDRLLELGDNFLNVPDFYELPLMYVWGHSFEFAYSGDWSVIEAFVEKMAGKDNIWYASNMEIYSYVNAVRQQEFSADGLTMYNPTAYSVWVSAENGLMEIKSGQVAFIGEK